MHQSGLSVCLDHRCKLIPSPPPPPPPSPSADGGRKGLAFPCNMALGIGLRPAMQAKVRYAVAQLSTDEETMLSHIKDFRREVQC